MCFLGKCAASAGAVKVGNPAQGPFQGGVPESASAYCPPRLIITPDILSENFNSTDGWTLEGAGATLEQNQVDIFSGTASLKLTTGAGVNASIKKAVNLNLSVSQFKTIKLRFKPHSDLDTTISSIWVDYASDVNFSNYYKIGWGTGDMTNQSTVWKLEMYNYVSVGAGNPDWSNIVMIRIRLLTKAGQISSCSFGSLTEGVVCKRGIVMTFDDGDASVFNIAYPILKAKKMVATSYIISDLINTAGYMTSGNLLELNANKWDIGNHTKAHLNLTSLTQEQVTQQVNGCSDFLDGLGLNRASKHLAYPFGVTSDAIIQTISNLGVKTGRSAGGWITRVVPLYDERFPYKMINCNIGNTVSLATAKGYIDYSNIYNTITILMFHIIKNSGASTNTEWLTSDFNALIDYIEQQGIQTLTIDEYYRLYSGGITVHHK